MGRVKLFLTDVDGVLTDSGMYYTESGDEFKKFNTRDGMGIKLLRDAGIKTGIITSEETQIVSRRAEKLKIDFLYQGQACKKQAALDVCVKAGVELKETAYIGDDLNCLGLLAIVGVAACPADAVRDVKILPGILQMKKKGGRGCVREFIELILRDCL